MSSSLDLFVRHRSNGALILSYEAITQQPTESVAAVASYLNVAARQELIAEIADANSFGRMREKVKEFSMLDYAEATRYDPETLINLDHIRDGSTGYRAGRLNRDQLVNHARPLTWSLLKRWSNCATLATPSLSAAPAIEPTRTSYRRTAWPMLCMRYRVRDPIGGPT